MLTKLKNRIFMSTTLSQQFKLIGISGLFVVLFWNILGQVLFHIPEATFFQHEWWSVWFPNYVVWSGLVSMGFFISYKQNNLDYQM